MHKSRAQFFKLGSQLLQQRLSCRFECSASGDGKDGGGRIGGFCSGGEEGGVVGETEIGVMPDENAGRGSGKGGRGRGGRKEMGTTEGMRRRDVVGGRGVEVGEGWSCGGEGGEG